MDLNTGTLNIDGSLRERITDITFTFAATQMDYLCLQDTRQTKREGLIIANLIRELLPPGSLVLQAPIIKAKPSDPPPNWRSNDNHQPPLEPPRESMVHGPHATRTPHRNHNLQPTHQDPPIKFLLASPTRGQPALPLTPCSRGPVPPAEQPTPGLPGPGPTSSTHLHPGVNHA